MDHRAPFSSVYLPLCIILCPFPLAAKWPTNFVFLSFSPLSPCGIKRIANVPCVRLTNISRSALLTQRADMKYWRRATPFDYYVRQYDVYSGWTSSRIFFKLQQSVRMAKKFEMQHLLVYIQAKTFVKENTAFLSRKEKYTHQILLCYIWNYTLLVVLSKCIPFILLHILFTIVKAELDASKAGKAIHTYTCGQINRNDIDSSTYLIIP